MKRAFLNIWNVVSYFIGLISGVFISGFFKRITTTELQEAHTLQELNTARRLNRANVIQLLEYARKANMPLDLRGVDLERVDLSNLDLTGALLQNANLSNVTTENTTLALADLRHANASGTSFVHANLAGNRIYGMKLTDGYLPACVFRPFGKKGKMLGDWEHAKKSGCIEDYHYAREVALNLKNHLRATGRNLEARWAYELEQRILRATINPWRRIRWNREKGERLGVIQFFDFSRRWIISWIADITTGYGERVGRVLAMFIFVQAIFTMGYWFTDSIIDVNGNYVLDLFSAILFSLAAMTTIGLQELSPANQLVEFFMTLQVIVGIAITGLLGFVLGNRIRYSA